MNRHRLARLYEKGGVELETIHQARDQPGYSSCRATAWASLVP